MPAVERLGMLVVMHSEGARRIELDSGAVGHTSTQIYLEGELFEGEDGMMRTTFPRSGPGNVLIIPRERLIDTGLLINRKLGGMSIGGSTSARQIMDTLTNRALGDVQYNACVSYGYNEQGQQEATYALQGSSSCKTLQIAP